MKASEMVQQRPFLDVCYWGHSGTGKSSRGARAPMPLIILFEPQAVPHIAAVNPDAQVILVGEAPELFSLMKALKKGRSEKGDDGQPVFVFNHEKEYKCKTLVLDSGSEAAEQILAAVIGKDWDDYGELVTDAKFEVSFTHWRKLQTIFEAMLHTFRSLPVHTATLLLAEEYWEGDDSNKQRLVRPMVYGKLKVSIGKFFTLVGYCDRARDSWITHWESHPKRIAKGLPKLKPVTAEDLDTPGKTTLGSIALAVLDMPAEKIPHEPGDSAEFAARESTEAKTAAPAAAENKQQQTTARTTRRR